MIFITRRYKLGSSAISVGLVDVVDDVHEFVMLL